jgi:hypothetical protein
MFTYAIYYVHYLLVPQTDVMVRCAVTLLARRHFYLGGGGGERQAGRHCSHLIVTR